jgi:type II secretory pathway component PulM
MADLMSRYSTREKLIVLVAVIIMTGLSVHAFLIEPYQSRKVNLSEQLQQARADLRWMKSMLPELPVSGALQTRNTFSGSLANLINQVVSQQRLNSFLAQITPRDDDEIRIRFSAMPFEQLIRFVARVNDDGLKVKDLRINAADNPGQVDSSIVLNKG